MPKIYFVGVDVGTSSARAALVTSDGKVLRQEVKPINIWNPEHEHFEQSSNDIWDAVCHCVKTCTSDVNKEEIIAISFDATCSLVILGENGQPLSVGNTRNDEQNVILWMDHRANKEADYINATKHELLRYVGGQVSVEMEMPKLLWLKNNKNLLTTWKRLWRAFDLPDFLTWRSTGCETRSLCSVVCKWNYDAGQMCWNKDFLHQIGLEDLCLDNFVKIGTTIQNPGEPVGNGLSEAAALELNLLPGTVVGTSLIDAHAGALGMFGCRSKNKNDELQGKLALICGTSTCHMSLTRQPCHAQGVWGPYRNAIIPGYYLNEGGQSATGLLLDHIIKTHPQYMHIKMKLKDNEHIYKYLNRLVEKLTLERNLDDPCYLTNNLHVWPDFHGNRSPIADASLRGTISGLGMGSDEESLAILYLAFVQALAYGTRHIIDNLLKHGRIEYTALLFCGGLAKNSLYVKCHADICQLPAIIPDEQEMVLTGAAMLGACAAKVYNSLEEASQSMGGTGQVLDPKNETKFYHNKKYEVFLQMLQDQYKYKKIMGTSIEGK